MIVATSLDTDREFSPTFFTEAATGEAPSEGKPTEPRPGMMCVFFFAGAGMLGADLPHSLL